MAANIQPLRGIPSGPIGKLRLRNEHKPCDLGSPRVEKNQDPYQENESAGEDFSCGGSLRGGNLYYTANQKTGKNKKNSKRPC